MVQEIEQQDGGRPSPPEHDIDTVEAMGLGTHIESPSTCEGLPSATARRRRILDSATDLTTRALDLTALGLALTGHSELALATQGAAFGIRALCTLCETLRRRC